MCMLAETLAISLFMIYIVVVLILLCTVSGRLIRKYPERKGYIISGSYIVFMLAIALLVWIFTYGHVRIYIEEVAKFILGV